MVVFFRTAIENNEQHEVEVASSRAVAEEDASNSSKDIAQGIESTFLALDMFVLVSTYSSLSDLGVLIHHFASDLLEEARNSSSRVVSTVEAHFAELQKLQESHSSQAAGINMHADKAFQNSYKVRARLKIC
jgi:kinesin family protein 11